MRRKIIKQKSAYTITLPVKWVRDHNLDKAKDVDVIEENTGLIISAQKQASQKITKLDLKKETSHYYRILIENEYLKGTTEIAITFPDQNAFETIQDTVSNLIGFEILEQEKNACRIGQTAMPTIREFVAILNRLFNIIRYSQKFILNDLETDKFESIKEIQKLENDTRRYSLFCRRTIHTQSIISRTDEFLWDLLLERLVITAYEYYFMYEKLSNETKDNSKINQDTIKLYKKACAMFDIFSEMFFKKKTNDFTAINDQWQDIYFNEGHQLLTKCTKKESIVLFHAINFSKMVWLISQPNMIMMAMQK
jgi:hypothetical protein